MDNKGRPPAEDALTIDTVFDVGSHSYRRTLLIDLRAHDQSRAVADVVTAIAVHHRDAPLEEIPDEELERIRISLLHAHVPKLEDADVVAFDRDRNTLVLTARGERLCDCIDRIVDGDVQLRVAE